MKKITLLLASCTTTLFFCSAQAAIPVQFQNGTATFTSTCDGGGSIHLSPDEAVDGNFNSVDADGLNGWGIAATCLQGVDDTTAQTSVWETTNDLTANFLNFTMYFNHPDSGHLLGRFRFSVTKDDRATFADGLDSGGDVSANWTELKNPVVIGPSGMSFKTLPDNSVLVGGVIPTIGTYSIIYEGPVSDITGVRLEALEDPSLPYSGPGLSPKNGNFVLTEMTLDTSTDIAINKAWITPTKTKQGEYVNVFAQIFGSPDKISEVVFMLGSNQLTTLSDPENDGIWSGRYQVVEDFGYKSATKIYVKNLTGKIIAKWPGFTVTK